MGRLAQARKRSRTGPLKDRLAPQAPAAPEGQPASDGAKSARPTASSGIEELERMAGMGESNGRPEVKSDECALETPKTIASDETKAEKTPPSPAADAEPLPAFGLAEDILRHEQAPAENEERFPAAQTVENKENGERARRTEVTTKYVTFFLSKEEYGLPIVQVQEINRVSEITKVPNAPDHVVGVVNLRGKILPVVELKKRLDLGVSELTKESRIVVVEAGAKILGLLVDRVSQVIALSSSEIEAAPGEIVRGHDTHLKGIGKTEGRMIILLDLESVAGKIPARA